MRPSDRRAIAHSRRIRALAACAALGAVISLAEGALLATGIWVNLSSSVPPGIYREDGGSISRGDCVLSCIPGSAAYIALERGYVGWGGCPFHTAPVGSSQRGSQATRLRSAKAGSR